MYTSNNNYIYSLYNFVKYRYQTISLGLGII